MDGAFLICEMFAYYASRGIGLLEKLEELYGEFGYCLNTLHSYTFEGLEGFGKMQGIMKEFREMFAGQAQGGAEPLEKSFAGRRVLTCLDYEKGLDGLPPADVLKLLLADHSSLVIRPSGTEPKLKVYLSVSGEDRKAAKEAERQLGEELEKWIFK